MILGIDPGITGALALVQGERCIRVWDMPVTEKTHGKGKEVNAYLLADIVREALEIADGDLDARIEQVAAMPGQGVTSMFTFGRSVGLTEGVLAAMGVRQARVLPTRWKRAYGLLRAEKDASRSIALARYPEVAPLLARKKDVGRADAMLIAGLQD